jgi:hypothetical protein
MKIRLISLSRLFAVVGLLTLSGSVALASGSEADAAVAQSGKIVDFGGISFAYDASLASGVTASVVPKDEGGPNAACWSTHPKEVVFKFHDFAFATSEMVPATIYVFPINSDYQCSNPMDTIEYWQREVDALQDVLARRPSLAEPPSTRDTILTPYLPPINAGGFLVGKQEYLNFRNGSGMRYLIQFTQQPIKPRAEDTIYTYQGITNDGKYYVAATLPAFLPAPLDNPMEQFSTQQGWDDFYHQLRLKVNQIPDKDFHPSLDALDGIFSSLTVSPSAGTLPSAPEASSLPSTGNSAGGSIVPAFVCALAMIGIGILFRNKPYSKRSK